MTPGGRQAPTGTADTGTSRDNRVEGRAMQLFNRYVSTRSLTVFAGELLLIFGSVATAAGFQRTPEPATNLWKIALVTLICQLCLYYNAFYDLTLVPSSRELIVRLLQAAGAASI